MNYIKRNLENVVSQVTKEYPVLIDEVQYARSCLRILR